MHEVGTLESSTCKCTRRWLCNIISGLGSHAQPAMSWLIPLPLPTAALCRRCSAGADAAAAPACANAAAALCQQARRVPPQARCRRRRRADRRQAAATCIAEVAPPKAGFAGVRSEAEFMAVLEAGVAAKLIPAPLLPGFVDFYGNYKSAGPGGEAVGSGCGGRRFGGQLTLADTFC